MLSLADWLILGGEGPRFWCADADFLWSMLMLTPMLWLMLILFLADADFRDDASSWGRRPIDPHCGFHNLVGLMLIFSFLPMLCMDDAEVFDPPSNMTFRV